MLIIWGSCTSSRLDKELEISIIWGLRWHTTRSGVWNSNHPQRLLSDLIRHSKPESRGGCTGSRLDQEFEVLIIREGFASSGFDHFNHLGAALAGQLDQELEISIIHGGCASHQLDQAPEISII